MELLGDCGFAEQLSSMEAKCAELKKDLELEKNFPIAKLGSMAEPVKKDLDRLKESEAKEVVLEVELQKSRAREQIWRLP